jgi:hypothetical protein
MQGKIIDCQLNSLFAFLQNLAEELFNLDSDPRSSTQIFVGAQIEPLNRHVERFLAMLWFEQPKNQRDQLFD